MRCVLLLTSCCPLPGEEQVLIPEAALDAPQHGRHAGSDSDLLRGTFCVAPVVYSGWDVTAPVPLWAACDNSYRGHVSCSRARRREYDEDDPWEYEMLHDCFRHYETRRLQYAERVGFVDLELKKKQFAIRAANRTALRYGLTLARDVTVVEFTDEECCENHRRSTLTLVGCSVGLFALPLFGYIVHVYIRGGKNSGPGNSHTVLTQAVLLRRIQRMRDLWPHG